MIKIVNKILPWTEFFKLVTSIVTDGERLNTGHLKGLCTRLKLERLLSAITVPLFSIWCVAHRINLAWTDLSKNKAFIKRIIKNAASLSTHFHRSGKRTQKLHDLCTEHKLSRPLRYPKYFEVRWTEYTYKIFAVVLRNWRGSIEYFKLEKKDKLLQKWLSYNRLHLMTFLCDILSTIKIFQKTFESNSISIFDISSKKRDFLKRMDHIKRASVDEGWEKMFLDNIDCSDIGRRYLFVWPKVMENKRQFTVCFRFASPNGHYQFIDPEYL